VALMPAVPRALSAQLLGRAVIAVGLVLPWLWLVMLDRVLRRAR
jgi:hypothetical protein